MGDWQELSQSVFIGLIFAFLVAKLIATVVSFREENLKVVRHDDLPGETETPASESLLASSNVEGGAGGPASSSDLTVEASERVLGGYDDDGGEDDDDWEGIESTELDELFSAATAFVAATAADRSSSSVSNDVQLQLYGLYKIATEGPCTAPQPSALKMTARAKWNAWQKLGSMPPEEAMQKYIMIVNELYPSWATGSSTSIKSRGEGSDAPSSTSASKGTMGPVFSSFVHEEESNKELKLDAIHVFAREGEADALLAQLDNAVSVNLRDSEGRTPLHWAVDRGHFNIVEILISKGADVNAKDGEGQTSLHYAILCERDAIAELLIKHGADCNARDNDGHSPHDL
uniref:Acyl-CoA-binding domain-containing protein 2 n=1 Tax=Anthurium amnicola TaxID=1678845 RepID=A0A1D1YME2_9ARAE